MFKRIIVISLLLLSSLSWTMSRKGKMAKELIGTIENDGHLYRAYGDIFTINDKPWSGTVYPFNERFTVDRIDKGAYRFSYSYSMHSLKEYDFYRYHTSPEEFEFLQNEYISRLGHWNDTVYSNKSELNGFICTYSHIKIIGQSPYNEDKNDHRKWLSIIFCYSDSLQFSLSIFNESGFSFGDRKEQLRGAKSVERNMLFMLKENLTINDKIYTEGIPEPLTEEELKKLRKRK